MGLEQDSLTGAAAAGEEGPQRFSFIPHASYPDHNDSVEHGPTLCGSLQREFL